MGRRGECISVNRRCQAFFWQIEKQVQSRAVGAVLDETHNRQVSDFCGFQGAASGTRATSLFVLAVRVIHAVGQQRLHDKPSFAMYDDLRRNTPRIRTQCSWSLPAFRLGILACCQAKSTNIALRVLFELFPFVVLLLDKMSQL
jgi:hypothetical protein